MDFMDNNRGKIVLAACLLAGLGFLQNMIASDVFVNKKQPAKETATDVMPEQNRPEEEDTGKNAAEEDAADGTEAFFYKEAQKQGIGQKEAGAYWERLLADQVFADGTMELTGLVMEDMDRNGQTDLLVMTLDREEKPFYGSGCLWIYMNGDEPYRFEEEDCSYYGNFEWLAGDIDNDGNVEIVLSTQGSGCGAVGDSYKVILKYKDDGKGGHVIQTMELPSDLLEDYDRGLEVIVVQEPEKNRYSAYCPYLGEKISFSARNLSEPGEAAREAGGNVRGFFNLCQVKYEGKNALQASEYLSGEGGVVHGVATAQFIILWNESGEAYVAEWWIEAEKVTEGKH